VRIADGVTSLPAASIALLYSSLLASLALVTLVLKYIVEQRVKHETSVARAEHAAE
jgi:ABC-type sulfate transport system permease subunit